MAPSELNIGLLLCDDVVPESQAEYGTYEKMFRDGLTKADPGIKLTPFRCMEGEFPENPQQFEAYVISGSKHGVYDGYPWIDTLMEFVRECRKLNIKTVGICFGHQLIAKALGGRAEKAEVGWGFGVHRAQLTRVPDWMPDDEPTEFNLVVIHQDQVLDPPSGFKTLAQNDFCPHSVISDNQQALGIQGHPEFSKEFCKFRADFRREIIGEEIYANTLDSLEKMDLDSDRVLKWVSAFLRH